MNASAWKFVGGGLMWAAMFAVDAMPADADTSIPADAIKLQIIATGNNNGELEECG